MLKILATMSALLLLLGVASAARPANRRVQKPRTRPRGETPLEKSARLDVLAEAELSAALDAPFAWRRASNDAHAILEVFGCEDWRRPPAYDRPGFDVAGRDVLDVGAQVGTFARRALAAGAASVAAFEPEPANARLLRENLREFPTAAVFEAAVVGAEGVDEAELVLGKDYQGVANTWRHSLRAWTHYSGDVQVATVAALSFGAAVDRAAAAAGRPPTFCKIDVEGAELDILAAVDDWRDLDRLVVEYSFTKRRSLAAFRDAADRLRRHFPTVECDRLPDAGDEWPHRTDALVFCSR